jgi:hypothetical protein
MASKQKKKEASQGGSSAGQTPRMRRYVFLSLPYVAVLLLFWIVNLVLPHLDSSLNIPFTQDIQLDGIMYKEINRKYLEPYFPAGSPMIPELKNSLLHPKKGPNSLRVLCLGESSMFGVPFAFSATIPSLVRKQLRHLYPDLDIEVINLAASAINTNVIREMVPQYLSLEPDIILIYTGHNEFYGPDGIGASWIERHFPGLTMWKYRARRMPIVLSLQRKIAGLRNGKAEGEGNLMRQVSGGAEVALDSPDAQRVFLHFHDNLRDIVHDFEKHHVPVLLGEVSSNLMFQPFAPASSQQPDRLAETVSAGRFAASDSLLAGVPVADSANAYYLYWRGRLSLGRGDTVSALRYLEGARDHDLLKFRAPGRVNDIIHEVGSEELIPVLPIDSLLRARSPHGITDTTFFSEHLHPTFSGYDQIARTFVNAIANLGLVRGSHAPAASLLPFNADSLSVPWLDLGVGALGLRNLTTHWPFTNMPHRRDVLDNCEGWQLNLAEDVYTGKVGWTDGLLQYSKDAWQHGKPGAGVTALSALVEEYPERFVLRYGLASALETIGRKSEAIEQFRHAVALKPGLGQPTMDFAFLLIEEGRYDEAGYQLHNLVDSPANEGVSKEFRAMALYGLAVIAANRDSLSSALGLVEESLRLAPGYESAQSLRSQLQRDLRR